MAEARRGRHPLRDQLRPGAGGRVEAPQIVEGSTIAAAPEHQHATAAGVPHRAVILPVGGPNRTGGQARPGIAGRPIRPHITQVPGGAEAAIHEHLPARRVPYGRVVADRRRRLADGADLVPGARGRPKAPQIVQELRASHQAAEHQRIAPRWVPHRRVRLSGRRCGPGWGRPPPGGIRWTIGPEIVGPTIAVLADDQHQAVALIPRGAVVAAARQRHCAADPSGPAPVRGTIDPEFIRANSTLPTEHQHLGPDRVPNGGVGELARGALPGGRELLPRVGRGAVTPEIAQRVASRAAEDEHLSIGRVPHRAVLLAGKGRGAIRRQLLPGVVRRPVAPEVVKQAPPIATEDEHALAGRVPHRAVAQAGRR